ncbi:hypothetical protein CBR_g54964 [Chara braunii]|uniref:Phosphatidic acid phosphatase type 2/haloperoxidase domain-containing protein n=1 Tax=Chara braunii TaxID=69332 RepID=A0A388K7F0_CHABU|nr:hypothetical protein CBR_g54964 [Chara braunii]|eukprot:GBG65985.1 hypothetical protein CBR_g54964 [Chara braunii]
MRTLTDGDGDLPRSSRARTGGPPNCSTDGTCSVREGLRLFCRNCQECWVDWCVSLGLAIVVAVVLKRIRPFERYIDEMTLKNERYPMMGSSTVPSAALPGIAIGLPLAVFGVQFWRKRDGNELHSAVIGCIYTVVLTWFITDSIKPLIGRPRPDFAARCFPDGVKRFGPDGNVQCTGDEAVVREGRLSFPSGHSALSFAGMSYLFFFLSERLLGKSTRERGGGLWWLVLALIPLAIATLVAMTRVENYRHHWDDCVVGSLIGIVMARTVYLMQRIWSEEKKGKGYETYRIYPDAHGSDREDAMTRELLLP